MTSFGGESKDLAKQTSELLSSGIWELAEPLGTICFKPRVAQVGEVEACPGEPVTGASSPELLPLGWDEELSTTWQRPQRRKGDLGPGRVSYLCQKGWAPVQVGEWPCSFSGSNP